MQGVYQFMPYWRVGLRTERLDPGTPTTASTAALFAASDYHPHKNSLMVDFSPSEFSRVRLQFAQDRARQGVDRQPVLPAVPDEPGRARRAQLLSPLPIRSTVMMTTPLRSRCSRCRSALLALPAHAALHVLRLRARVGRARAGARRHKVDVSVATNALQDPHQIQAKPSLIARARNADLVVCTGAELEIGWLPVLLQQSGNAKVQPGQPGNFAAADFVRKLEVPEPGRPLAGRRARRRQPAHPDRPAQHRAGRRPRSARGWPQLDPAHAGAVRASAQADFSQRWQQAIARWTAQAAPLKGVAGRRRSTRPSSYLYDWLGLKEVAVLEPKPGVEPTRVAPAGSARDAEDARRRRWSSARPTRIRSRPSGSASTRSIPAVKLPFTVGGTDGAKDLFGLFDDTVARLLAARSERAERAMNWSALDWGILGRRWSPACWCSRRTCRSARRCSTAASSSSTWRSRRSPASA